MKTEMRARRNSNYLVTVVVPIFNMQDRLHNLFSWLPEASQLGFQVILVNNCCTDNTDLQLIQFIKLKNLKHVQLVKCDVPGPGVARDYGRKYSEGEFTLFWDSDDIGYPKVVQEILEQRSDFDLLVTSFETEPVKPVKFQNRNYEKQLCKFALNPGLWRCIVRSSVIEEISFGGSIMGEDQVFLARILSKNPDIQFSPLLTYKYFSDFPNQLTSNKQNLRGLRVSISEIALLLRYQPIKSEALLAIIYIKLCLTGIKLGNFGVKLSSLSTLTSFLILKFPAPLMRKSKWNLLLMVIKEDPDA